MLISILCTSSWLEADLVSCLGEICFTLLSGRFNILLLSVTGWTNRIVSWCDWHTHISEPSVCLLDWTWQSDWATSSICCILVGTRGYAWIQISDNLSCTSSGIVDLHSFLWRFLAFNFIIISALERLLKPLFFFFFVCLKLAFISWMHLPKHTSETHAMPLLFLHC
jgi:hypothetical protein